MPLTALRDDALASTNGGFTVRIALPWIRSLPLRSVQSLSLTIDGEQVDDLRIDLGGRLVSPDDLALENGWWFLQDRMVLRSGRALSSGDHRVATSFNLFIPYLQAGPGHALVIPIHLEDGLTLDSPPSQHSVSRDVA